MDDSILQSDVSTVSRDFEDSELLSYSDFNSTGLDQSHDAGEHRYETSNVSECDVDVVEEQEPEDYDGRNNSVEDYVEHEHVTEEDEGDEDNEDTEHNDEDGDEDDENDSSNDDDDDDDDDDEEADKVSEVDGTHARAELATSENETRGSSDDLAAEEEEHDDKSINSNLGEDQKNPASDVVRLSHDGSEKFDIAAALNDDHEAIANDMANTEDIEVENEELLKKETASREQTPSNVSLSSKLALASDVSLKSRENSEPKIPLSEEVANGVISDFSTVEDDIVLETVSKFAPLELEVTSSSGNAINGHLDADSFTSNRQSDSAVIVTAPTDTEEYADKKQASVVLQEIQTKQAREPIQFGDSWFVQNTNMDELDVFGDASLRVRILRIGAARDSRPLNGERVRFNYRVAINSRNGAALTTVMERRDAVAAIGDADVLFGIETALKFIELGALARVLISSRFAYGSRGLPPSVPPDADLVVEIEVVSVELPVDYRKADSITKRAFVEAKRQRARFYQSLGQPSCAAVCSSRADEIEKLIEVEPCRTEKEVPLNSLAPNASSNINSVAVSSDEAADEQVTVSASMKETVSEVVDNVVISDEANICESAAEHADANPVADRDAQIVSLAAANDGAINDTEEATLDSELDTRAAVPTAELNIREDMGSIVVGDKSPVASKSHQPSSSLLLYGGCAIVLVAVVFILMRSRSRPQAL